MGGAHTDQSGNPGKRDIDGRGAGSSSGGRPCAVGGSAGFREDNPGTGIVKAFGTGLEKSTIYARCAAIGSDRIFHIQKRPAEIRLSAGCRVL